MTVLGGGVVLARRESIVLPLAQLLERPLPPVCAVSGLPAQEMLPARISGRHTPLWLLLFGIVPYVVVRVVLGSGETGLRVHLPVTRAVADRFALARTTLLVSGVVAVASMFAVGPLGPLALLITLPAGLFFFLAALVDNAMAVRPRLRHGLVVIEVSTALRDALQPLRQPV